MFGILKSFMKAILKHYNVLKLTTNQIRISIVGSDGNAQKYFKGN